MYAANADLEIIQSSVLNKLEEDGTYYFITVLYHKHVLLHSMLIGTMSFYPSFTYFFPLFSCVSTSFQFFISFRRRSFFVFKCFYTIFFDFYYHYLLLFIIIYFFLIICFFTYFLILLGDCVSALGGMIQLSPPFSSSSSSSNINGQ